MKRRSFVKTSLATSALSSVIPSVVLAGNHPDEQQKAAREFYELRVYTLKNEAQQRLIEDYFQNAAIPALNRLGSKNIGVFTEHKPEGAHTRVYSLIPFRSFDNYMSIQDKMSKDATYQQKGAAYLNAPATEPAYERIESSLLQAFSGMPRIMVPEKKGRLFELRRYESASESAGKKKIEMFDSAGEIAIFKRVGLTPVFFGETLIGTFRPNLTYMLVFDDMAEHDKNWKAFGGDPEWNRIKAIPEYADAKIVSRITRTFLLPTAFSQL